MPNLPPGFTIGTPGPEQLREEARQADATAAQPRPSDMVVQSPEPWSATPADVADAIAAARLMRPELSEVEAVREGLRQATERERARTRPPLAQWPTGPSWLETPHRLPNLTSANHGPDGVRGGEGDLFECTATGAVWRMHGGRWEVVQSAIHDLIPLTDSCPFYQEELRYKVTLGVQTAYGRRIEFVVEKLLSEATWALSVVGMARMLYPTFPAAVCKMRHEAIQLVRDGGTVSGSSGLPLHFANRINDHGRMLRADRQEPYPFPTCRRVTAVRDAVGNVAMHVYQPEYLAEPWHNPADLERIERERQRVSPIIRDILDSAIGAMAQSAAIGATPVVTERSIVAAASAAMAASAQSAKNQPPIKAADYWRMRA